MRAPGRKDREWKLFANHDGTIAADRVQCEILMDIRDELKRLNRTFDCSNFQQVPTILRRIRANTAKPRKPKGQP